MQSTALATTSPTPVASLAFEPSDVESAFNLAKILVESKLLPRSLSTPAAAFTVIMAGRELGLTAMQSLRSLHVIEGKPVMSADLMVALCLRSSVCESFRLVESTDKVATYEATRKGEKPVRLSWTKEQAQTAGLLGKANWKNHLPDMLRARCKAALARIVFPDLMLGIYDADEIGPAQQVVPTVEVVNYDEPLDAEHPNAALARDAIAAFEAADSLEALGEARAKLTGVKFSKEDGAALKAAYEARVEALKPSEQAA